MRIDSPRPQLSTPVAPPQSERQQPSEVTTATAPRPKDTFEAAGTRSTPSSAWRFDVKAGPHSAALTRALEPLYAGGHKATEAELNRAIRSFARKNNLGAFTSSAGRSRGSSGSSPSG